MTSGWAELGQRLLELLPTLAAEEYLVLPSVTPAGVGCIVQYAQRTDRLDAEVVVREDPPNAVVRRQLSELGWVEPEPPETTNWWTSLPWPAATASYRQLVNMSVVAMRDVLAVDAATLRYKAWDDSTGRRTELPALGLDPMEELG
jgi:hypothetical protein